jgi:ABC-type multidrug transport system ATPase subunit
MGMKQRIDFIRAVLNEPEILFLDEPTLGLNPQSTSEIRDFVQSINVDLGRRSFPRQTMFEADGSAIESHH